MGTLYLVATPIGNLEDITHRAVRTLREVRLIAAEDTRHARTLLRHYEITTPLTSYFEHNKLTKLETILAALEQGDVALISDAGTPGLSDPGYELIVEAIARDVSVVPIPGPSAPIAALVSSGLPTDRFVYVGFLPRKQAARRRLLSQLARESYTLVCFEAPHRLSDTLADMADLFGDRSIAVARELTKLHEEIWRGTLQQAVQRFADLEPRGEFTLVVGGVPEERWSAEEVEQALRQLEADDVLAREAVREVAEVAGWAKRDVYRLWLAVKGAR
jgi:16S rRNA (cytidine1402-2'-O)-methyltransferase